MDSFSIKIHAQYVKLTSEREVINGKECLLHEVQKRMKFDFEQLPEFTVVTAPTGTGKSYAFPFPVLNAKKKPKAIDDAFNVRGLIILPTNALICELTENFKQTYPQLIISQITSPELDKLGVKGYDRWKKVIEIALESDLVITNPDLINFAMHGGYHQFAWNNKTGETRFSSFLDKFNYIIFDEYHLYDETQIANILTMVKLRECLLQHYQPVKGSVNGVRFLFVSATPEIGLKRLFESEDYEYKEIIENIISDKVDARPIHGELNVEFFDCKDIRTLIRDKIAEIREVVKTKKVLLILNRLRDVQELAQELLRSFNGYTIYQSTGYVSKTEDHSTKIKSANIIIATNKAEVGVNYDVEYCIMQPGKYFENFVQRFGRVSRGDLEGKIIIAIDDSFSKYKKVFKDVVSVNYYEFLDLIRERMQGRKFYEERIPLYIGEYIWCISNQIRRHQEYDVWRYLKRRLNETDFFKRKDAQRYYLFQSIHSKICQMMGIALKGENISQTHWDKQVEKLKHTNPRTHAWADWWRNYINTYLTFRDSSKVVKIYDRIKDEELDYSLDWILQHKVIERIETIQKESYEIIKYTVGNLKKQDKDIQYTVSTLPNAGMSRNNLLSYNEMFELDKVFKNSVSRIYDKVRKGVEEIDELQTELCREIMNLSITFNRKRLKIDSIENEDNFL